MIVQVVTLEGNVLWLDLNHNASVKDLKLKVQDKWSTDENIEIYYQKSKLDDNSLVCVCIGSQSAVFTVFQPGNYSQVVNRAKAETLDYALGMTTNLINKFILICSKSAMVEKVIAYLQLCDQEAGETIIKELFTKLRRKMITVEELPLAFISEIESNIELLIPDDDESFVFENSGNT
ncbi:hypothetical protein TVAG_241800 [Trichomonas vaginalis G3]|uniref:Ubiquitin-like domain-containing protein n=1 Tax=Trichomonas vaginalis (strain ATCC PRA-98 / G3) TaxID=412133 RepID=A2FKS1_TRIV3|nr:ubiquitin-like family [Trichomonas vaginalis G3]EAX94495.1 hypothetical protein TVAG_241800 [Trichomonas vaginalis G3]KAI5510999.1 ubiquitin-like family [Trichomonas vaginalis G3]|eukprot:XP_001307425.1 hypothetical protein [Trichomonas vaginalis G3]